MKGYNLWSYAPYKPLLRNVGDIYICRTAICFCSVKPWKKKFSEEP